MFYWQFLKGCKDVHFITFKTTVSTIHSEWLQVLIHLYAPKKSDWFNWPLLHRKCTDLVSFYCPFYCSFYCSFYCTLLIVPVSCHVATLFWQPTAQVTEQLCEYLYILSLPVEVPSNCTSSACSHTMPYPTPRNSEISSYFPRGMAQCRCRLRNPKVFWTLRKFQIKRYAFVMRGSSPLLGL